MNTTKLLTVCVIGASSDEASEIARLLDAERAHLDAHWQIGDHATADLLLIDAESLYGHMDWLKARASQRLAAAITNAPEAHDTEFWLSKPITGAGVAELLNRVGAGLAGKPLPAAARVSAPAPVPPPAAMPAPVVAATPPPPPRGLHLVDLLDANPPIAGRLRLAAEGLPVLLLDPRDRTWHSAASLKILSGWGTRTLAKDDVQTVDDATFAKEVAAMPAHPYARLRWLAHLAAGAGRLEPDLDPTARYKLSRWPQSEREFPKHFRIATVMLKQAATLDEIASESGAPAVDVADFINAYHSIGYVESDSTRVVEDVRRGGLFGRMKKTSANS